MSSLDNRSAETPVNKFRCSETDKKSAGEKNSAAVVDKWFGRGVNELGSKLIYGCVTLAKFY